MPKKSKSRRISRKVSRRQPKAIDRRLEDFAEEVGMLGERYGKHVERKYNDFLGDIGPLIQSIIGLIFFVMGLWILNIVNTYFLSVFLFDLSNFFFTNIGLFFLTSLLFNYGEYFSKRYKYYCVVSPVVGAVKVAFVLWVITSIFYIIGNYNNALISNMAYFFQRNILAIFFLALILGYAIKIPCCLIHSNGQCPRCKK